MVLTIGIPTWNRASKLSKCLLAFSKQIRDSGRKDIKIIVSDNGSTDQTIEVVSSFQKCNDYIYYQSNGKNIGAAKNCLEILKNTQTEYLWYFGDDDLPMPGAIDKILHLIKNYQAPAYHLAAGFVPDDGPRHEMGNLLDFCNRYGFLGILSCLPTIVVRVNGVKAVCPTPHLDGVFFQTCTLFEAYAHSETCLVRESLISYPQKTSAEKEEDNKRWISENTLIGYYKIINSIDHWFSSGLIKEKLKPGFFFSSPNYLWDRYNNIMLQYVLNAKIDPTPEMILANERISNMIDDRIIRRLILSNHDKLIHTVNSYINARKILENEMKKSDSSYI